MAESSPQPLPKVLAARRRRRRYNERQDRGAWVCDVEMNNARIRGLIDAELLTEREALDRRKVAAAMVRLVDTLGAE